MSRKKIRLAIVTWDDIQSRSDWIGDITEIPKEIKPIRCVTVGWIVREDKQIVVVADSYTADGTYGGATAIPTSVIENIQILDENHPRNHVRPTKRKARKSNVDPDG